MLILGRGGGGGKYIGVGDVIQGGSPGGNTFGGGDVVDDPPHGMSPGGGGGSTQGSSTEHWEASPEVIGRNLVVSTSVYGDAVGGFLRDGGICAE